MTGRRIVANLDAEDDLAGLSGDRPGPSLRPAWTREALAAAAAAGTLLRVFAAEGDSLRLPAPVAPDRLADVPGLPRPHLESGPLRLLPPAGELLAWCETPEVAAARPKRSIDDAVEGLPLHERLWRLPMAVPAAVAAANHRGLCREIATEIGCVLPGARMVRSFAELSEHLAAAPAGSPLARAWIVKAPFSAAGRSRYVERNDRGAATNRRHLENLFARHGSLLLEPWMERTADFGAAALLLPDRVEIVGLHRQSVDRKGQFAGLEVGVEPWDAAGLRDDERDRLGAVVEGVGARLRRLGYLGPFGIDCWRYRDADGAEAFHPLGEINARMTIGLVARALVDRLRSPLALRDGDRVRLCFGKELPESNVGPKVGFVPLLYSGGQGEGAVWLERPRKSYLDLDLDIFLGYSD